MNLPDKVCLIKRFRNRAGREITQLLQFPSPLDMLHLKVTVAESNFVILQPLYQMIRTYFLLAMVLVFFANWLAKRLSQNLLANLNALIERMDVITSAKETIQETKLVGDDREIIRLTETFNDLLNACISHTPI